MNRNMKISETAIREIREFREAEETELMAERKTASMEIRLKFKCMATAKPIDVIIRKGGGALDPVAMEVDGREYAIDPRTLARALSVFVSDPTY